MSGIRLIVGLGNPGRDYERTRHNAGFWMVERLAAATRTSLRKDSKYHALLGRHEGTWLLLPQTYMNLSGKSVSLLAGFFKIAADEVLVAHDELDFPPGTVRLKRGGGVAGHNGLKDIAARIGSTDFWRVRIGIGHPGDRNVVGDYVLGRPAPEDRDAINASIDRALDVMPLCLSGDLQGAMHRLHTRNTAQPAKKGGNP